MKIVLPIISLLILASCSSSIPGRSFNTNLHGIADPLYENRAYESILVKVELRDLRIRQQLEAATIELLKEKGIAAYSDLMLFPPTREWTEDKVKPVLTARNIQSVLIYHDFVSGEDSVFVPGYATTTERTKSYTDTTRRGKAVDKSETTVETTYNEPRVEWHSWVDYSIVLTDVTTNENAWIATAQTRGSFDSQRTSEGISIALYSDLAKSGLLKFTKAK